MSQQIEAVVAALNAAFEADPVAMFALQGNRVACNEALADDPNVIVERLVMLTGDHYMVGAMGLLNGCLMAAGVGRVATMWDQDMAGHNQLTGFCAWTDPSVARPAALAASDPPQTEAG